MAEVGSESTAAGAAVGQHHRIVDGRGQFSIGHVCCEVEGVAGRSVNLGRAPDGVGVLHPVAVMAVAGHDGRPGQHCPQVGRAGLLAGMGPQRHQVGDPQQVGEIVDSQAEHSQDPVGAVGKSQALFLSEDQGLDPRRRQGLGPVNRAPSSVRTSPSPISTSAAWASGARLPLAPSEPCSGTAGTTPALTRPSSDSATCGLDPEAPTMPRAAAMADRAASLKRTSVRWRATATTSETVTPGPSSTTVTLWRPRRTRARPMWRRPLRSPRRRRSVGGCRRAAPPDPAPTEPLPGPPSRGPAHRPR